MQIVTGLGQLLLQALTAGLQVAGVEPLFIQLGAQHLRLLFSLHAAGFLRAHLLVDPFQRLTGRAELLLDRNALLQQGFQLDALVIFRRLTFFQRHAQLLTALGQPFSLHLLPFQPLPGAFQLRIE